MSNSIFKEIKLPVKALSHCQKNGSYLSVLSVRHHYFQLKTLLEWQHCNASIKLFLLACDFSSQHLTSVQKNLLLKSLYRNTMYIKQKSDDTVRNINNFEFTQTKALTLLIVLLWLNCSTACNGNEYTHDSYACQQLQGDGGLSRHTF